MIRKVSTTGKYPRIGHALPDVEEGDEDSFCVSVRGREDPEGEPHAQANEVNDRYPSD